MGRDPVHQLFVGLERLDQARALSAAEDITQQVKSEDILVLRWRDMKAQIEGKLLDLHIHDREP